ncbi:MAG TPA: hypothetical protein DC006_03410 [Prevotellaceae bacterium]|nr:hypothetical protein [Prevotellaceae bacterium]
MEKITYRMATAMDAAFVALVVAEAVGGALMERVCEGHKTDRDRALLKQLTAVCRRDDTLYSWRHTRLAVNAGGQPVGALVAYVGEGYRERRARTFALLEEFVTFDVDRMDDETRDGEYYLDSLAVLPPWRGRGIARRLLACAQADAARMGRPAILACAPGNTGAKHLYESLGFREEGHMFIFGEDYLRMVSSSIISS